MSLSIYVSFSNVLSLFLLLHCDPGLKLSFQVYFSGIYGMCWRLLEQRAAKRGLCGRFCGFISVFLNFVWYPFLFTVLWSKVMVPCTWLKRTHWRRGRNKPPESQCIYVLLQIWEMVITAEKLYNIDGVIKQLILNLLSVF